MIFLISFDGPLPFLFKNIYCAMKMLIFTELQQHITLELLRHTFPPKLNTDNTRVIIEFFKIYQSSCKIKIEEIAENIENFRLFS